MNHFLDNIEERVRLSFDAYINKAQMYKGMRVSTSLDTFIYPRKFLYNDELIKVSTHLYDTVLSNKGFNMDNSIFCFKVPQTLNDEDKIIFSFRDELIGFSKDFSGESLNDKYNICRKDTEIYFQKKEFTPPKYVDKFFKRSITLNEWMEESGVFNLVISNHNQLDDLFKVFFMKDNKEFTLVDYRIEGTDVRLLSKIPLEGTVYVTDMKIKDSDRVILEPFRLVFNLDSWNTTIDSNGELYSITINKSIHLLGENVSLDIFTEDKEYVLCKVIDNNGDMTFYSRHKYNGIALVSPTSYIGIVTNNDVPFLVYNPSYKKTFNNDDWIEVSGNYPTYKLNILLRKHGFSDTYIILKDGNENVIPYYENNNGDITLYSRYRFTGSFTLLNDKTIVEEDVIRVNEYSTVFNKYHKLRTINNRYLCSGKSMSIVITEDSLIRTYIEKQGGLVELNVSVETKDSAYSTSGGGEFELPKSILQITKDFKVKNKNLFANSIYFPEWDYTDYEFDFDEEYLDEDVLVIDFPNIQMNRYNHNDYYSLIDTTEVYLPIGYINNDKSIKFISPDEPKIHNNHMVSLDPFKDGDNIALNLVFSCNPNYQNKILEGVKDELKIISYEDLDGFLTLNDSINEFSKDLSLIEKYVNGDKNIRGLVSPSIEDLNLSYRKFPFELLHAFTDIRRTYTSLGLSIINGAGYLEVDIWNKYDSKFQVYVKGKLIPFKFCKLINSPNNINNEWDYNTGRIEKRLLIPIKYLDSQMKMLDDVSRINRYYSLYLGDNRVDIVYTNKDELTVSQTADNIVLIPDSLYNANNIVVYRNGYIQALERDYIVNNINGKNYIVFLTKDTEHGNVEQDMVTFIYKLDNTLNSVIERVNTVSSGNNSSKTFSSNNLLYKDGLMLPNMKVTNFWQGESILNLDTITHKINPNTNSYKLRVLDNSHEKFNLEITLRDKDGYNILTNFSKDSYGVLEVFNDSKPVEGYLMIGDVSKYTEIYKKTISLYDNNNGLYSHTIHFTEHGLSATKDIKVLCETHTLSYDVSDSGSVTIYALTPLILDIVLVKKSSNAYNKRVDFASLDWNSDNGFYLTIDAKNHNMEYTKYLHVDVKDDMGRDIVLLNRVLDDGTVILYSETPFNGRCYISSLNKPFIYDVYDSMWEDNSIDMYLPYDIQSKFTTSSLLLQGMDERGFLNRHQGKYLFDNTFLEFYKNNFTYNELEPIFDISRYTIPLSVDDVISNPLFVSNTTIDDTLIDSLLNKESMDSLGGDTILASYIEKSSDKKIIIK